MIRKRDTLLAAAGLALFAFAAGRVGWSGVIRTMEEARTAVAIIVGLSLIRLVLQTRAWSIALRADGIISPARELMLIRLASQGIGYLSVLGPVASEPMKISLLRNEGGSATTATLVDTGVYWFTSGMVGIAGCFSAALLLAHSHHSVTSWAILGAIFTAVLFLIARPKLRLLPLVGALGVRCPRWLVRGDQIEGELRHFKDQHPSSIRRMFLLDVACQVLLAAEVVTIFWSLKLPFHASTVLGIEGASRAVKMFTGWMPARIGVDESGVAGIFFAFGLSPASGLTLALARRSRDLLAALIGLAWLAWRAKFSEASSDQTSEIAFHKEELACKL